MMIIESKNRTMPKALVFSGRNFKELLRDPVSWAFGIAMPLVVFLMQIILKVLAPKRQTWCLCLASTDSPAALLYSVFLF